MPPTRETAATAGRLTRFDAHPYQAPAGGGGDEPCALCGERRNQARHQERRIRAACLLRGLDPDAVLRGGSG